MPQYRSTLISILALAKSARTAEERERLFELAETYSKATRKDAVQLNAEHQRRLVEIMAAAKHARTDEERAALFRTAEELSEKARQAEETACDSELLAEAALLH